MKIMDNFEKIRKVAVERVLRQAAAEEVQAWYQYIAPVKFMQGGGRDAAMALFIKNGDEEIADHLDKLLGRLAALNANVGRLMDFYNLPYIAEGEYRVPHYPYDVATLVQDNIKAEEDAITTYRHLMEVSAGVDEATHALAAEILGDEERHLQDLKKLLLQLQ